MSAGLLAEVRSIQAIALTAFREAIRDRVLFAVVGMGLASVLFGLGLGAVSYGEATRVLVDHGLVTISWLANLLAILLGASFLYKEIELRTLYVLLARPIRRHDVILGKYVGIVVSCAVFVLVTGSLLLILLTVTATNDTAEAARRAQDFFGPEIQFIHSRALRVLALVLVSVVGAIGLLVPRVRRILSATAVPPIALGFFVAFALVAHVVAPADATLVIFGCLLVLAELLIPAALSMLFSSISTPFVTAAMSFGAFLICRSTWLMQHLHPRDLPAPVTIALRRLVWVIPNLHLYVPSRPLLIPDDPTRSPVLYVLGVTAYAGLYAAVLVSLAALLFRRRDLT